MLLLLLQQCLHLYMLHVTSLGPVARHFLSESENTTRSANIHATMMHIVVHRLRVRCEATDEKLAACTR